MVLWLLTTIFAELYFSSLFGCRRPLLTKEKCRSYSRRLFWQLHRRATVALLLLPLFLPPDPLQCFAELPTALWARQITPPKDAANPPHLKTAKDQGDQTQLDVSPVEVLHYAL